MGDISSSIILIQLILAHIIVDFFIQPKSWIKDRRDHAWHSRKLYIHSILAGIVPLILLGDLKNWPIVPVFVMTHLLIDGMKCHYEDNLRSFIVDQALHLVLIVLVWLQFFNADLTIDQIASQIGCVWNDPSVCLILLGIGLLTLPASILIGYLMKDWWSLEIKDSDGIIKNDAKQDDKGLKDAGRMIGVAERTIIFALIIVGQFTAIGFVIATKSIFRLKDGTKRAEYYLVGSMLSFSLAIVTGLIIRYLMSLG